MNTAIGYKLFRIKKSEKGKLFPLYVFANEEVPMGVWLQAKEGETKDGKVLSRLGSLRFRPGWHINSDCPYVSHIGKKVNGKIKYMSSNTVWCEVEYNTDFNYCDEAKQNGYKNGKFKHLNADLNYIPIGGYYKYKTNPNMTGEWIIAGEMKVNKILNDEEVKKICQIKKSKYLPRETEINLKEYGFVI